MTTLLVAISGGHLTQLKMLSGRIVDDDVVWLTNDTAQSRSLLDGERVYHVPTRPPRDYAGVLRDTRVASKILRDHDIDAVISTGAQIALSALLPASHRRIPFTYIESATRVTGISTTGKIMERVPWVRRFVQYPHAVNERWAYALSVFDGFRAEDAPAADSEIGRVVVTVGGNGDFGFRRLVDAAAAAIPPSADVLWQIGSTDPTDLPFETVTSVPSAELADALTAADVVIGHAGTGTALAALQAGKIPILSPRSVAYGEHVDAHQRDLADFLAERGLAIVCEPEELTRETLDLARRRRAVRSTDLAAVTL